MIKHLSNGRVYPFMTRPLFLLFSKYLTLTLTARCFVARFLPLRITRQTNFNGCLWRLFTAERFTAWREIACCPEMCRRLFWAVVEHFPAGVYMKKMNGICAQKHARSSARKTIPLRCELSVTDNCAVIQHWTQNEINIIFPHQIELFFGGI